MHLIYSLEDDQDIAKIIKVSLEKAGYQVESFPTAASFVEAFESKKPDLILLDLMLPDGSGMDILKKIRSDKENDEIKIIILSAKRMTMDKVEGLDNGADDYIEKPFDILELISRVNARFRQDHQVYMVKDITLDATSRKVTKGDKTISLTNTEFDILYLLMKEKGKTVSREDIYKKVYHNQGEIESRAIDVHVASLRKKLLDKNENIIRTIYGIGYILD